MIATDNDDVGKPHPSNRVLCVWQKKLGHHPSYVSISHPDTFAAAVETGQRIHRTSTKKYTSDALTVSHQVAPYYHEKR